MKKIKIFNRILIILSIINILIVTGLILFKVITDDIPIWYAVIMLSTLVLQIGFSYFVRRVVNNYNEEVEKNN